MKALFKLEQTEPQQQRFVLDVMAGVTKPISAPRLECLMVWQEMPFLIMIKFVLSVIAKGTLLNIAEQIMVDNEAIFMYRVDQTVVLENPPFVLIVALQVT